MVTAYSSIQQHTPDSNWLDYFNPRAAVAAVIDHCDSLPSARTERHTHRVYTSGLKYFLGWAGSQLPTEDLLTEFIAHLKRDRGLKSSTIQSKYLAPVRLYLRKLARQHIPVHGPERDFVMDCKERLRGAADDVKAPPPDETSILSPLYQHGQRLSRNQLETVYRSIERTIKGRRDLALLYVGFTTGLRVAELQRMTLNRIIAHADHYLIRVRGKRSNTTPVPLDYDGWMLIQRYVTAYNDPLDQDDPRRITGDTPLWQHILHGDNHAIIGINGYDPQSKGISRQAIRNMMSQRVDAILGIKVSPHDMRRTIAALGRQEGMEMDAIQQLLRHKNMATTARYIGRPVTFDVSLISRKKRFTGIQDDAYEASVRVSYTEPASIEGSAS